LLLPTLEPPGVLRLKSKRLTCPRMSSTTPSLGRDGGRQRFVPAMAQKATVALTQQTAWIFKPIADQ